MPLVADVPLDEVVYLDFITSRFDTGAAVDADSTPTFEVFEEATDTDIGVGGNATKRTSKTGNYRVSFTISAANGFEVGKWYNVTASATVNSVAGKGNIGTFRVVAAEATAGKPKVDVDLIEGSDATNQIRDSVVDDSTRIDASALNTLSGHDPGETIMGATDLVTANVTQVEGTDATNYFATLDDAVLTAIAALSIPTANQNADALLDRVDGVETSYTLRQAMRLILAALVGKLSGAAGTSITIRDINDTVNRIAATVDADGNRLVVTKDVS